MAPYSRSLARHSPSRPSWLDLDLEALGGEAAPDGLGEADLVVDHQHAHGDQCAADRRRARTRRL